MKRPPDIQVTLRAHILASEACRRHAEEAMRLLEAGKLRAARAAHRRAEECLSELRKLEGRASAR